VNVDTGHEARAQAHDKAGVGASAAEVAFGHAGVDQHLALKPGQGPAQRVDQHGDEAASEGRRQVAGLDLPTGNAPNFDRAVEHGLGEAHQAADGQRLLPVQDQDREATARNSAAGPQRSHLPPPRTTTRLAAQPHPGSREFHLHGTDPLRLHPA
jgi:hypothetical protein